MQPLVEIRQKKRFLLFNKKSKEKVLDVNAFFGKYQMMFDERIKKTFIYYDTPDKDLEKSNIVLYKTVIGNFCELNMSNEKVPTKVRYTLRNTYRHYTKQIKHYDSILKHKEFLIENFANMFLSGMNFDIEFLMRKLQVAYVIQTVSEEYKSVNATGLKITYSFDSDKYTNNFDHKIVTSENMTIYQHSGIKTDADFDDLISKLTRYCKELTPVETTKIALARQLTKFVPPPTQNKYLPTKKELKEAEKRKAKKLNF